MIRSASVLSVILLSTLSVSTSFAQGITNGGISKGNVFLPSILPTPAPKDSPAPKTSPTPDVGPIDPTTSPDLPNVGKIDISKIVAIGEKVWDFVVNNKPTADYKTLKANVIPEGMKWTQLAWQKDKVVSKVYHVEFKNVVGGVGGSFDYRISFIYGGSYKGKGKFIGQIAVAPTNIQLKTDRSITFRAEILDALNFGTEEDPVAGVQLLITWSSPTTTRYEMKSVEYFLYADGEVQDLTNGTFQ